MLEELDYDALKTTMFERLHRRPSVGPPIDPRGDYPPYAWLLEELAKSSAALRTRMNTATEDFLSGVADTDAWPPEARGHLLNFAAEAQLGSNTVDRLIRDRAATDASEDELALHAALLRCSVALGLKFGPDVWLGLLETLGDEAGSLVFGGLAAHSMATALNHLAACCTTEENAIAIGLNLPSLVARFGLEEVGNAFEGQFSGLPSWAVAELREALEVEGYTNPVLTQDDAALEAALYTQEDKDFPALYLTWGDTLPRTRIREDLVVVGAGVSG